MIDIYTDGACKGNPGPAGWAALIGDEMTSGAFPCATNNYAELYAILEALSICLPNSNVRIYTDSKLCIGWLARGWKRNLEYIDQLVIATHTVVDAKELKLTFRHVKGHSGIAMNERVDKVASLEAAQMKSRLAMRAAIQEG